MIKRSDDTKFGFTELTFGNGVRMILKPTDFKNDEIVLSAYSPGGTSLYPDSDLMSANLATTIITQSGLGDYDFTGLQKKLSGNTARLSPYINDLNEGVNGTCSPKDLETMLQLNYLYFTKIRRDESAYDALISRIQEHDKTHEVKSAGNFPGYSVQNNFTEFTQGNCYTIRCSDQSD